MFVLSILWQRYFQFFTSNQKQQTCDSLTYNLQETKLDLMLWYANIKYFRALNLVQSPVHCRLIRESMKNKITAVPLTATDVAM